MPKENTLTINKLTLQTLEAELYQEMPASEDGGGESNPWNTNLFYNMNLQQEPSSAKSLGTKASSSESALSKDDTT